MRPIPALLVALCFLAAPAVLLAGDKPISPTKAYNAFAKKARNMSPADKQAAAETWLAEWEASGRKASSKHVYSLALFQKDAGQFAKAAAGMRAVQADLELKERTRDLAASVEASMLLEPAQREALGKDGVQKDTDRLCKYAARMDGDARRKSRSTLRYVLGQLHEAAGRSDDALAMRLAIVADDPGFLSKVYGVTMRGLLGATHAMAGYDGLRKKAASTLKALTDAQSAVVANEKAKLDKSLAKLRAKKPDALDADGNLKETERKKMSAEERSYGGALRKHAGAVDLLERIRAQGRPFELLGKPAPAWSVEKAFGDVSAITDLKGKVALLYFWGTSRKPSIAGLPAIRALARDHGEKGLVVVGVTATEKVCYESRFDLDPDFADRASGGRPVYYARLASEGAPPDENQAIYAEEAYAAKEIEAVTAFTKNHEMAWPIVQIGDTEPADLFALDSWPHTVILDKQGRVRFLKAGPVGPGDVAAVGAVIEALLGES